MESEKYAVAKLEVLSNPSNKRAHHIEAVVCSADISLDSVSEIVACDGHMSIMWTSDSNRSVGVSGLIDS